MKFRFKKSASSISVLIAALCCLVALVFTVLSETSGAAAAVGNDYKISLLPMVVSFCAVAAVLCVAAYVLDGMFEGEAFSIVCDVLRLAAVGLIIACFSVMVSSRAKLMGYIWFSTKEKGNGDAVLALNFALVSWVFYFLGVVSLAVSLFKDFCVGFKKTDAKEETKESDDGDDTLSSEA